MTEVGGAMGAVGLGWPVTLVLFVTAEGANREWAVDGELVERPLLFVALCAAVTAAGSGAVPVCCWAIRHTVRTEMAVIILCITLNPYVEIPGRSSPFN